MQKSKIHIFKKTPIISLKFMLMSSKNTHWFQENFGYLECSAFSCKKRDFLKFAFLNSNKFSTVINEKQG